MKPLLAVFMFGAAALSAAQSAPAPASQPSSPVSAEARPARPIIERVNSEQRINFDLLVKNSSSEPLTLTKIEVTLISKRNEALLRRFIDGNGVQPSLDTIARREVPAGGTLLIFNPFHTWPKSRDLATLSYELTFEDKAEKRSTAKVSVSPVQAGKDGLLLPLSGKVLTWDAHDFYAHHRRWDYEFAPIKALGFKSNAMRYSYDFVPLSESNSQYTGDPGDNKSWFGFGRSVLAVDGGKVIAVTDSKPDDRHFEPADAQKDKMALFGNYIVVEHGAGVFAVYGHIKQGSALVKVGQNVKAGMPIAAIGASGSSLFPHLHFQLQDGPDMDAEGVPSYFGGVCLRGGADGRTTETLDSGEMTEPCAARQPR